MLPSLITRSARIGLIATSLVYATVAVKRLRQTARDGAPLVATMPTRRIIIGLLPGERPLSATEAASIVRLIDSKILRMKLRETGD